MTLPTGFSRFCFRLGEGVAVALVTSLAILFQTSLPITLGPSWLLYSAFGVPFAVGLAFGRRAAIPVAIGTLAVAIFGLNLSVDATWIAVAISLVEVGVASFCIRRGLPITPDINRPRDVVKLAILCAIASSVRGLIAAVCTSILGGDAVEACAGTMSIGWLGNLLLAPMVVLWFRSGCIMPISRWRSVEAIALYLVVMVFSWLWFCGADPKSLSLPVPVLAIMLMVGNWVAFRFHTRGTATLLCIVGTIISVGCFLRGTIDPLLPLSAAPVVQWLWLVGMGVVVVCHLIVAAAAREYRIREEERDGYALDAHRHAKRLSDVNARLALQSLEIADQATELEIQRDGFAKLARELAEKRAWLEGVIAQLPVGIMLIDNNADVVARNTRFNEMLGLPGERKIGNLKEFDGWPTQNSEGESVQYADFPLVRAMKSNTTTLNLDMRIGKFDGDWVELGVSATPLRGEDGATTGGVLVMQDLSSMRHAERRALDQEDRLRLLESAVVNARDAVVILDAVSCPNRGRPVRYVNMAFTQITGYTAEEVVGRSLHFLRGPKTDTTTLDAVRSALDTCGTFRGEMLNYSKSGEEIWVSLSLVPVWGANGRCTHFVMIQRDITDQKKTEEIVRRSEELFRGIFETTSAGVSITGPDSQFTSCNPAFAALIGRTIDEVVGLTAAAFTHPDDWAMQQDLIVKMRNRTIDRYQLRKRYLRPDGAIVWAELSFTAIYSPTGEYQYGLGVTVDVTARLALEEQLRQAQKIEALGQLAGGVAHDFNNLLTAVLGNLALVHLVDGDPAKALLHTVEVAASRAADLTQKLLGYARRNQLISARVRPAALIEEVVDILRRTLDPRIEIHMFAQTEAAISVDATLMNQALFNLCLNARDAMPDGGRLTLDARKVAIDGDYQQHPDAKPGEYVCLTVSDTGTGISDDVKRRMYEPFFTTKGVGRGTGLGLSMVQGILKQHRGWVTFESTIGVGTQFDLYLPVAPQEAEMTASGPTRLPGIEQTPPPVATTEMHNLDSAQPRTILLVDDESMIRLLGRTILEQKGYEVLEAVDGADAVDLYSRERSRIDLVILDMTMPRMSGRDAFQRITTVDPNARVIFSSGYTVDDLSEIDGAMGILSKPYRPNDLLAAVRQALQNGHPSATKAQPATMVASRL